MPLETSEDSMFDGRWRTGVDKVARPFGVFLVRAGATADLMTFSGLCCAVATAVAVGTGHFPLGVVLLTLTGFHDALDGAVAKVAGTASVRGAFFDSVADRLTDAILLGGVAYWLSVHRTGAIVLLPFAVLTVSFLVSYERAKAESLGLYAKGGLMERAERMIVMLPKPGKPEDVVPGRWMARELGPVPPGEGWIGVEPVLAGEVIATVLGYGTPK